MKSIGLKMSKRDEDPLVLKKSSVQSDSYFVQENCIVDNYTLILRVAVAVAYKDLTRLWFERWRYIYSHVLLLMSCGAELLLFRFVFVFIFIFIWGGASTGLIHFEYWLAFDSVSAAPSPTYQNPTQLITTYKWGQLCISIPYLPVFCHCKDLRPITTVFICIFSKMLSFLLNIWRKKIGMRPFRIITPNF